jgi:TonB family protein
MGVLVLVAAVSVHAETTVPIQSIDKQMVAGERQIHLPDQVLREMAARGISSATIAVKLCISADGAPSLVELHKSSGYQAADDNVLARVRDWRFKPYIIDGKPVPVCAGVFFNYAIGGADPLDAFKPLLGKWRCGAARAEAKLEYTRTGPFVTLRVEEQLGPTRRQVATWITYDADQKKYVSASTDDAGNAWIARSDTPGSAGFNWVGPELTETQNLVDGTLQRRGHLAATHELSWDMLCAR